MNSVRELLDQPSIWLRGDGPHSDIVLSSRLRLARNLAGRVFPGRAGADDAKRLLGDVLAKTADIQTLNGGLRLELEPVELIDRRILGERLHASAELVRSPKNRGIVVSPDESRSFRINDEDHIRVQSMCSGLDLERAYAMADALDSELDARLGFAFDDAFGFLTANPADAGTGLRASVLLHVPALVMDHKLDAVITDLKQAQCSVRGFREEGGGPPGSLVQVSNSVALGLRETEILRRLSRAILEAMKREGDARERLLSGARSLLEDRVWRSFGVLRHARLLSAQETLYHASLLRLGMSLGFLELGPEVLQDVLGWSQDAHAQLWSGTNGHELERSAWRAEQVRKKLKGISA